MKKIITVKSIRKILLVNYGIRALKISPTEYGIVNHSFFIEAEKKKYVFRIYSHKNKKSKKDILFEVSAMKILRENNVPTPQIIKNKSKGEVTTFSYEKNNFDSILMDFMKGNNLVRDSLKTLELLAKMQARVHDILLKKIRPRKSFKSVLKKWGEFERDELIKMRPILKKYKLESLYFDKFKEAKREMTAKLSDLIKAPYAECHLDFQGNNILVNNKRIVGILDFDNIEGAPLIFDSANTLRSWLGSAKPNKYRSILNSYIKGYEKFRKLSDKELTLLPTLILVRNFGVTNALVTRKFWKTKKRIAKTIKFHDDFNKFRLKNKSNLRFN